MFVYFYPLYPDLLVYFSPYSDLHVCLCPAVPWPRYMMLSWMISASPRRLLASVSESSWTGLDSSRFTSTRVNRPMLSTRWVHSHFPHPPTPPSAILFVIFWHLLIIATRPHNIYYQCLPPNHVSWLGQWSVYANVFLLLVQVKFVFNFLLVLTDVVSCPPSPLSPLFRLYPLICYVYRDIFCPITCWKIILYYLNEAYLVKMV